MKVMVTGAEGQLGWDVMHVLKEKNIECIGVDREQFDLTDPDAVRDFVYACRPTVIVHCAGYTAVDKAEEDVQTCLAINGRGTANLVRAAKEIGAALLYISTDYVFSGEGEDAWETYDRPKPLSVYGLSKLQGEQAVLEELTRFFIVRISWLFGVHGKNFVRTMLRLGQEKSSISVVNDQVGSPTYARDLAEKIVEMIHTEKYGIYHVTNEGVCSWAEFAETIMEMAHLNCRVHPVPTSEYPTPARRPQNSVLSKQSLDDAGFDRLPHWEDALLRYLRALKEEARDAKAQTPPQA
ncbi:MAG: dTDP-4-dehydrorhamnose reductase [Clostridia bacterium]|nr:dTDP-4-dehydrorhamnose reductase [Clostridia bacterium]MBR2287806.1 dTDP-4-dehydrorhamnose reductase [Clostridia bacterium]